MKTKTTRKADTPKLADEKMLKQIRTELLEKGYSGPWPMFDAKAIEPVQKLIYAHMKPWLVGDNAKLSLVEKLRLPVRKDTPQSVGLELRKKMTPHVEKFAESTLRVRQIFETLLDTKQCKPCSMFQDFRGNLPVKGQALTGWHQDNETFFLQGRPEWKHPNFTMWISLNGAEPNNAMEIIPNSHASRYLYAQHYNYVARPLEEIDPALAKIKPIRYKANPGEAFFLTPMTFHRSVPNGQEYARFSMDMRYYDTSRNVSGDYRVAPWLYWKKAETMVWSDGIYKVLTRNPILRKLAGRVPL
jgi:hypothetical protein